MEKRHKTIIRICSWFLFVVYLICMVYFLFFSEKLGRTPSDIYHLNLKPFAEIRRCVLYADKMGKFNAALNLIGNVICFMPFGFVIPILSVRQRKFWKVTVLSFFCSVIVEVTQLVSKLGSCDVDDVILNTIGGMLGYILFRIGLAVMHVVFPAKVQE